MNTWDKFLLVRKQPLMLNDRRQILLPMSHEFDEAIEAKRWMVSRGMQATCRVATRSELNTVNTIKNINSWIGPK